MRFHVGGSIGLLLLVAACGASRISAGTGSTGGVPHAGGSSSLGGSGGTASGGRAGGGGQAGSVGTGGEMMGGAAGSSVPCAVDADCLAAFEGRCFVKRQLGTCPTEKVGICLPLLSANCRVLQGNSCRCYTLGGGDLCSDVAGTSCSATTGSDTDSCFTCHPPTAGAGGGQMGGVSGAGGG